MTNPPQPAAKERDVTMLLLPTKPGTCPMCGVDHKDHEPHNKDSLAYQYKFWGLHGRWPTWSDAIAHCADNVRAAWKEKLQDLEAWNEPEGEPIASPVHDSLHEPVKLPIEPIVVSMSQPIPKRARRRHVPPKQETT